MRQECQLAPSRFLHPSGTPAATAPAPLNSATTRSSASWLRPLTATLTPLSANQRQVSAPMPPDPPVTNAVFPFRSGYVGLLKAVSMFLEIQKRFDSVSSVGIAVA